MASVAACSAAIGDCGVAATARICRLASTRQAAVTVIDYGGRGICAGTVGLSLRRATSRWERCMPRSGERSGCDACVRQPAKGWAWMDRLRGLG